MRLLLALVLILSLSGCSNYGLEFHSPQEMTPQQMLDRASLVFIGVIEQHRVDSWPFFRVDPPPGESLGDPKYWKIVTRVVRVETVLRGVETQPVVNVYEIAWTGGATGPWNATQNGERALFLVRKEGGGRYHVVRDWWRSIFPVAAGVHAKLPLDASRPFWERIALMNWWIGPAARPDARIGYPYSFDNDPGRVLSMWRTVKLQRGLVRHPSPNVRIPACRELLQLGSWGQDECWETLLDADRARLRDGGWSDCTPEEIATNRRKAQELPAERQWRIYNDLDSRRLLTAISNRRRREEFCRLYAKEYPGDHDNGCPADRPPPATIVTEQGDVPLVGPWPSLR